MPSLKEIMARFHLNIPLKTQEKNQVYVVYGRQTSPFPDLEYIEPIIAVVSREQDCFSIQEKYSEIKVSWEARKVQDSEGLNPVEGTLIYLTHAGLEPYMEDSEGNPVYGIMQSPQPEALYGNREAAEREAPDFSLHEVRLGDINLRGVGELLE